MGHFFPLLRRLEYRGKPLGVGPGISYFPWARAGNLGLCIGFIEEPFPRPAKFAWVARPRLSAALCRSTCSGPLS